MIVIKDTKNNWWLEIDRVVQGMDVVTTVEPVYNYKAATQFSTELSADKIIEQIKSEGNYDVSGYMKENTADLDALDKQIKEEEEAETKAAAEALKEQFNESIKQKLEELKQDLAAKGKSEEEIQAAVAAFEATFEALK